MGDLQVENGELKDRLTEAARALEKADDELALMSLEAGKRIELLERALGGMLFGFDDGAGRDWSADLLDFTRKLTPAVEFNPKGGTGDDA